MLREYYKYSAELYGNSALDRLDSKGGVLGEQASSSSETLVSHGEIRPRKALMQQISLQE